MKERLVYVDQIKGFAMLLVVMGHVIAWLFQDINSAALMPSNPVLLWQVIYSFHMPLFLFVSGLLFGYSKFASLSSYLKKMLQKGRMLLVPYFVCGTLVYLWRGMRPLTYWYFLTLFQLILWFGLSNYLLSFIKTTKVRMTIELATMFIVHFVLHFIARHYSGHSFLNAFDWFPHLSEYFIYFALGNFLTRNVDINKILNNAVYSMCLVLFFIGTIFNVYKFGISLCALSAIYCVYYYFRTVSVSGAIGDFLQTVGKNSLYVYVFHMFLVLKITDVGNYLTCLSQSCGAEKSGIVTCFVIELFLSLIISVILCFFSLGIAGFVHRSNLLSLLLFGETKVSA